MSSVQYLPIAPGYRVGDDGTVWSQWEIITLGGRRGRTTVLTNDWHQLTPFTKTDGYLCVNLYSGPKKFRPHRVHVLVLEAFVGPRPSPQHEVRHFPDRDKTNNRLSNLQWGSKAENAADRRVHGTQPVGSQDVMAKLTEAQIPAIRAALASGETQDSIAARYKVSQNLISGINIGTRWAHVP